MVKRIPIALFHRSMPVSKLPCRLVVRCSAILGSVCLWSSVVLWSWGPGVSVVSLITAQSVQRLTTGWTVRGSNPGVGENFRIRLDRPWGPPSLLYNGYRVFPGGKSAGTWRWPPSPPPNAKVEGRVELYICSRSRPSWTVLICPRLNSYSMS